MSSVLKPRTTSVTSNDLTCISDNMKSSEQKFQELKVLKSELTCGNIAGEVYTQMSQGSAFLITERHIVLDAIVEKAENKKIKS
mmetsp:Transcript_20475/g.31069  ORF Transcript_20475/g.31069 Transcript_20475/m.31069 type:complete len:84 (+) Transcript_20475:51-302(+)